MRILLTVIGLAALLGAATLAAPEPGGQPGASVEASIDPVRQPVVCPGPLEVPVGAIVSGDEDLDSGSSDVTRETLPSGEALGDGTAVDATQAVTVERVASGDIAGLAGAACTAPARDQWLVGGSTALGSSARLVLSNPTGSAVRARIEIHGAVGLVEDDRSVLLGPGAQETLLLESVTPELPALAVHVVAQGVGVSAALQDSRLDGFTAAGTDWVSPSAPATELVIPVAGPSAEEAVATLSLLAPDGADATLTLLGEEGPLPWLGDERLALEPGVLTDLQVPVVGLAAVRIEASDPVVAGALVRVARDAAVLEGAVALDQAWTGGQDAADARARAAVVPDGDVTLVVASAAAGTFTVDAGGHTLTVDVAEDGVASLPLDLEPGTVLTSSAPFAWALVLADPEAGFVTTIEPVSTELEATVLEAAVAPYSPAP
ncbi:DUF5719 family protein [Demequina sp. NBRC 110056]|uniref:DUF5719 family protein n=1 Tax=Demequina sp. NBRC 110056 TaxID=1570345 RepID=UPI000A068E70|nr:DUF5719 family protein [Demequina sp. NBRC 110056]